MNLLTRLLTGVVAIAFFIPPAVANHEALPKAAVYAADDPHYIQDVVTKLTAIGKFAQVDNLSPLGRGADPTPQLSTLQQYSSILVYSNYSFNNGTALGNILADYVDAGGVVIISTFGLYSNFGPGIGGRFASGGYLPVIQGNQSQGTRLFLIATQPSHPLLAGVASFDGGSSSYHNVVSLASGATLVARWTNGVPLVAFKNNVVALNFFPPSSHMRSDFWNVNTNGTQLLANALGAAVLSQKPVANAGADQIVNEGATVILNGSGSYDPNTPAKPLTYSWTQMSGVTVSLANGNTANPSFTAPAVPKEGAILEFRLTVSNGVTAPVTDSVTINVGDVNMPPTANAGSNQTVNESAFVQLSGSGTDPDDDLLTLTWTQIGGPSVALSNADTPTPSFTAPAVSFAQGSVELTFQLTVNDGLVSSGPSDVVITVNNTNAPPLVSAGSDQSVNELEEVVLKATASDPNGDALSYSWVQIAGDPEVVLSGTNTDTVTFTAPELANGLLEDGTTLTFRVTVSDAELSSESTVNVRVSNVNHPPLADAGVDKTVPENTATTLGGASADTDGDTLRFAWVQIGGPTVALDDPTAETPTFTTPDVNASGVALKFMLTVDDGYGGVTSDDVVVTVTYVNRPPVADAGAQQTVPEGTIATLAATASDPDANDLSYVWIQISGPTVSLTGASGLNPSFTAPAVTRAEDNVVLRLTVSDLYGGSVSDDVTIHISNLNRTPVAIPPANMTVAEGALIALIGQGEDADTEEQSQLTYQWQQIAPVVSEVFQGSNQNFIAPLVTTGGDPNASVVLTFRLIVTDPNGAAAEDEVAVTVTNVPQAPTAKAGGKLNANEAASVTLNGSASEDPDGDQLTYSWVQIDGPEVELHEADTAYPYFTAPFTSAQGATLKFKLTVNDGFGGSSEDTATVCVANINTPPSVGSAQASTQLLWAPDHRLLPVSILNVIDPDNNASIAILGVTQDEPTNGLGDGDTAVDAIINEDRTSVLLRAERSGKGDGRVYRVKFVAWDFEGSSEREVKVVVPKSKKTDAVVDSGASFNSTE